MASLFPVLWVCVVFSLADKYVIAKVLECCDAAIVKLRIDTSVEKSNLLITNANISKYSSFFFQVYKQSSSNSTH